MLRVNDSVRTLIEKDAVPAGSTGVITELNVKKFFCDIQLPGLKNTETTRYYFNEIEKVG